MARSRRKPRFILDQDFPDSPLVRLPLPDIDLVALRSVYPDLVSGHDDWQVLQQLRARGGADAFVTLDAKMLRLAKEMVVLAQTRLTLVVFQDIDNDPITAGGLLVATSSRLSAMLDRRRAQVFQIRRPRVQAETPAAMLLDIASRANKTQNELRAANRLPMVELLRDCRATP